MLSLFKVAMNPNVSDFVNPVLQSGFITQGPKVKEFEKQLSDYVGNDKLLTLNAATSGLTLALRLLFKSDGEWPGMVKGDEVLTSALTCTATNWPILANDLNIKWVDVDQNTANMNLDDLKDKLSPTTKVILVVHWGGTPTNLNKLKELQDYSFDTFGFRPMIIEDCAHAFGSEYEGRKLGCHGNICVFSFQAIKHLTTGDGGMIILPNDSLYERAKLLRWYGIDRNARNFNRKDFRLEKDIAEWGYKFHMNDISATIGLSNLSLAIENSGKHQANAKYFSEHLRNIEGVTLMKHDDSSSYWIYSMKVDRKQDFINFMKDNGIAASQVHNRNDNHSCVSKYKTCLPNLDQLEDRLICIPVGWWLTQENLEHIVEKVKEFFL